MLLRLQKAGLDLKTDRDPPSNCPSLSSITDLIRLLQDSTASLAGLPSETSRLPWLLEPHPRDLKTSQPGFSNKDSLRSRQVGKLWSLSWFGDPHHHHHALHIIGPESSYILILMNLTFLKSVWTRAFCWGSPVNSRSMGCGKGRRTEHYIQ